MCQPIATPADSGPVLCTEFPKNASLGLGIA
jgi:hypothetical protein